MTTATLNESARVLAAESGACAGVLPYWPVWAAAQFASNDSAKSLLNFVHIWLDGDTFQIESTDGHRAFRYRFPAWTADCLPTLWRVPDSGLLLWAKPLKKAVSHARLLTVTEDMRAIFHGGKREGLTELSSVNTAGFYSVHTASDCSKVGMFPRINQLWPDRFTNQPSQRFGFNARYLKEWCAVAERLSANSVTRCECNAPVTPFVWSADYSPAVGEHLDRPQLEMLIMPVQLGD